MPLLFALIVVIAASFLTASAASPFYNSSTTGSLAGVDVSTLTSSSTASCFVSSGISFIIPRGFKSSGTIDSNVCGTLTNSKNAGIPHRDVYLFPCPTCTTKTADDQVAELVNYLNSNCKNSWSGRIWLDIEGSQYWLSDYTKNKAFYQGMIDSCKNRGYTCGVYASSSQWSAIFGSTSYVYNPQALPLWYPRYDNNPSFADFATFGGWKTPYAKQYYNTNTFCDQGVDKNYAPYWSDTNEPAPTTGLCSHLGYYCGLDGLGGSLDANTLYYCSGAGAIPSVSTKCGFTCVTMPSGQDDTCSTSGSCSSVNTGYYCGTDKINGDKNTLYYCKSSNPYGATYCSKGCTVASSGYDDYCTV